MFKNLEQAKMYMPTEIYDMCKYLDFESFKITETDNNGENWHIVKGDLGVNIFYKGKPIKKLNWFERVKVFLNEIK